MQLEMGGTDPCGWRAGGYSLSFSRWLCSQFYYEEGDKLADSPTVTPTLLANTLVYKEKKFQTTFFFVCFH